jgi:hypothetical protein
MALLISEIHENEHPTNKNKKPSITYALAERLFSYFVFGDHQGTDDLSRHDIIMIRPSIEDPEKFDGFVISMDDIAEELFRDI